VAQNACTLEDEEERRNEYLTRHDTIKTIPKRSPRTYLPINKEPINQNKNNKKARILKNESIATYRQFHNDAISHHNGGNECCVSLIEWVIERSNAQHDAIRGATNLRNKA
jgi:hypothetical protein